MTTDEPTPFMDYWKAVDAAMLKFFCIDTGDAGIEPDLIASAQDECQTPEDFARWYGDKHDLTYLDDPTDPKQTVRVLTIMLASEY